MRFFMTTDLLYVMASSQITLSQINEPTKVNLSTGTDWELFSGLMSFQHV